MKTLVYQQISLGCDPEFFFTNKGKICGSEKILKTPLTRTVYGEPSRIIVDGVQAELNPAPNMCRANLGNEISKCFRMLHDKIKDDKNIAVDFSQVAKISKEELMSLSEKSRKFGCAPSDNIYENKQSEIKVDAEKYLFRPAGGHIHIGKPNSTYELSGKVRKAIETPKQLVPLLDILVGCLCVLIDKDKLAKKRRKIYGKAGEFRIPAHGLEYRTLSNFWLQSYQLFSFVMGMTRLAVLILANGEEYEKSIIGKVKEEEIKKAINNNDFELAMKNYEKIESSILEMVGSGPSYPINTNTVQEFRHFITKPLDYWFKENPLNHWAKLPEGHGTGWETFCTTKVKTDRTEQSES